MAQNCLLSRTQLEFYTDVVKYLFPSQWEKFTFFKRPVHPQCSVVQIPLEAESCTIIIVSRVQIILRFRTSLRLKSAFIQVSIAKYCTVTLFQLSLLHFPCHRELSGCSLRAAYNTYYTSSLSNVALITCNCVPTLTKQSIVASRMAVYIEFGFM